MKLVKLVIAAALFTACSHNSDLYDPEFTEKNVKAQYFESFVKTFPNVDLNQSWDYSHKNPSYSLPSDMQSKARTRAASYSLTTTDEYEVDGETLSWLTKKLPEQNSKNRSLGSPFYMSVPDNSFTIVPIYQGKASSVWELHMVVDGVDIKVWEKSQDMWVKKKTDQADWTKVYDISKAELDRNTIGAAKVKTKGYTFENLPVGANMYFYLVVTRVTNNKYKNTIGVQLSSLIGQMLSLDDCPHPTNIPEGNEVMIVGCEDANNGDWDMNDLVFMVYGKPSVPKTVIVTDGTPITKKNTVRYMIEDLGSTDDFDFNDIVVDVSEVWTSTPHYVNGKLNSWTDSDKRQEAVIRHLGGILPFKLKIGDTELEEHQGVLGSNPDELYAVSGWNINSHNVSVQVKQSTNSTVYNNVVFPKAGEAPMIIAVDPTVQWMNERQCVPESWFYEP